MANGEVHWRGKELELVVDGASDELLTKLAFQAEAHAKVNITDVGAVDTGFMRNAVYGLGPNGSHRGVAEVEAALAADRPMAETPEVKKGEAVLHAAAEYTIYQEEKHGFMYQAVEQVKKLAGGTIREVGRKHFGS